MLKQTYIEVKADAISFMLAPHRAKCPKCQEIRNCNPDDYRIESDEFCTPEDYTQCPLVRLMEEARTMADEMEYQDTYGGQELLREWKRKNMVS